LVRRPPRSTLSSSSAASDVYKRQERGLEPGQALRRGAGSRWLVGGSQPPTLLGAAGGDADQVRRDLAGGQGLAVLALRGRGEGVAALFGDLGEAVVQVLRRHPHNQRGGVDDLLGDEPRVG